ncbi:hypothetical protein D9757_000529 [Collybiopsis confluens]|uniref:Uncharacterized protein n=1 Tax=Collybiopsis confluens TaxID=2823264 RepID=A0A8H5I165_9AGAR|nr:hypothetical protein D9757_000529 [Collybiopsis confluens]
MRLPPLPRNGQPQYIQPIRSTTRPETWPQFPLPDSQYQSSRTAAPMQNYPVRIRMTESSRDPHISAFETNQAMDALADARSSRSRQYSHNTFDQYNQREQAEYSSRSSGGSDMHAPELPIILETMKCTTLVPFTRGQHLIVEWLTARLVCATSVVIVANGSVGRAV